MDLSIFSLEGKTAIVTGAKVPLPLFIAFPVDCYEDDSF